MMRSVSPKAGMLFWALSTALGYYMLAAISLHATKGADNIAAVWPPSGYFLALLLIMPGYARYGAFAAMITASAGANIMGAAPVWTAVAFTTANACEAGLAFWMINRRERGLLSFMALRSVGNFCIAALAASLLSAGIATLLTGSGLDFFRSWLTTVALGMLIVTPPIVMLARLVASSLLSRNNRHFVAEAVLMMMGAAVLTAACFSQSDYPVTFLPYVAVVAASYRLGPFGAATSVLIVTILTAWMTGNGLGPIAAMDEPPKRIVLFLQFYLLILLFTALPLAALLVSRQRLAKRLEQSNRWLVQAEAAALVGHWRVDLVHWTIQWSDQTYRVHGLEPGTKVDVDYSVEQYLPEDRADVRRILEHAVRTGTPFEYQGRIVRADGAIRHVKSHGSIEMSRAGKAVGIFGTVQDVTEMVENALMLEAARNDAEAAANTDALTGLPNRRYTLAFLETAMRAAIENDASLAVAIFDIDHFKRINDEHGHGVGDSVIRRVAQRARLSLRDDDMVGRFGGEEFVCIFQGPSARAAELVAERLRKAIEGGGRTGDGLPPATVSIGLAVYAGETGVEELLQRADEALYTAKREGRNQLRMAA